MLNRDYKQFTPDCYYHIFNRGNGKQDIFLDDADRKFFLFRMKENLFPEKAVFSRSPGGYVRKALPTGAFTLINYCLMPNHFHFCIRQNTLLPLSKLFLKVCTGYSKYFNLKYTKVGNLLQSKFKAVMVTSDAQLLWLSAYIHQNPKVAGLVDNLENYPWSSYPDYIGARQGTLCYPKIILDQMGSREAYKKFVANSHNSIQHRKNIRHLLLDHAGEDGLLN